MSENNVDNISLDDDEDLDAIFNAESEAVGEEALFTVDKPNWSVSREELLKVFKIVDQFPAKSTVFFAIWKEGGLLKIHSNNKDSYVDCTLSLLNDDPYDTDRVYFLNYKVLQQFVSSYTKFVLSFDETGAIYYQSPYSQYKLELYNLDLDKCRIKEEEGLFWNQFPITHNQLCVLKSLYGFSFKITDNKVRVSKDMLDAFFTLYQYKVIGNTDAPENYIIRRIDIPTLCEVSDSELQVALTPARLYFKFPLGVASFMRLKYNESEFMYPDTFATGNTVGEFQFDIKLLRRALKLTSILSASVVTFRSEEGNIFMYPSDHAKFNVGSGTLNEEFSLNTDIFTKIVSTIDQAQIFVAAKVTEKGIDLTLQGERPSVYSISRMTTGQLKRQEKINNKTGGRDERKAKLAEKGELKGNVAEVGANDLMEAFENDMIPSKEEVSKQFLEEMAKKETAESSSAELNTDVNLDDMESSLDL